MGLYSIWQEKTDDSVLGAERVNAYIREYFGKEKDAYAAILAARENRIEGTVGELAEKFGLEPFEVTAFIDGINTSLNSQIEVETLEADSNVVLDIDWNKDGKLDWRVAAVDQAVIRAGKESLFGKDGGSKDA